MPKHPVKFARCEAGFCEMYGRIQCPICKSWFCQSHLRRHTCLPARGRTQRKEEADANGSE